MKILLIIPQKPYAFIKKIILLLAKNEEVQLFIHKRDYTISSPNNFYNIIDKRFPIYSKSPLDLLENCDLIEQYQIKILKKISYDYDLILDLCDTNLKTEKCFKIKTNFEKNDLLDFTSKRGRVIFNKFSSENNPDHHYNYVNNYGVINNYYKYLYSIPIVINLFLKRKGIPYKQNYIDDKKYSSLFGYYFYLSKKLIKRKIDKNEFNWKLAFLSPSDNHVNLIKSRKGEFWADPFFIQKDEKYYVFFEELKEDTQKGVISLLILNQQGEITEKKIVMDKPFHMSFPNVFEFEGSFYMLAEQIGSNKLVLYKAKNFPTEWIEFREIFNNKKALDPVLLFHNNLYYLFTNIVEDYEYENNERMSIFYTDDLLNGKWHAHENNPVKIDASSTRNGGKIYKDGDSIIRIAQDCSKSYGYSNKKMKIIELSPSTFEEIEIENIKINGYKGNHTYNKQGDIVLIDVLVKE